MRSTTPMPFVVLVAAWGFAPPSAGAQSCVYCHVKPAEAVTDELIFLQDDWEAGVHVGVDCIDCHPGADADAFDELPHRMGDPPPPCGECHPDEFRVVEGEIARSVHATGPEAFSCVQCHDPHFMRTGLAELPREKWVGEANQGCVACHREAVLDAEARVTVMEIGEAHAWDPALDAHLRIRCVVCHTPVDRANNHEVVPGESAVRNCEACHDVDAPLISEYVDQAGPSFWVTNPLVFKEAYLPGATRNRVVDAFLVMLFWLAVFGVVAHAFLRVLTRRDRPRMSDEAEKTSMYPVWIRLWHWSNAFLFIVLAYTGVRLHFGQRRGPILSFETAFDVHNVTGVLLILVGVTFFLGNLLGPNQRQYLSRPRDGLAGIRRQALWYLIGIFKGEPHPYHPAPEHKFNPLQHLTYVGLMYVMYPLLLLSGVVLLFPGFLPERVLGFPGVWWVAALHWLAAAAGILFLVGHLYLGSMGDKVRDLYAAMLDGRHRHRRPEVS